MRKLLAVSVLVATGVANPIALAEEDTLKQCRAIQKEVARLESRREYGGSAKSMDSWKRRIHDKQDEYSKLYCRRYRFELNKR